MLALSYTQVQLPYFGTQGMVSHNTEDTEQRKVWLRTTHKIQTSSVSKSARGKQVETQRVVEDLQVCYFLGIIASDT